MNANTKPKGNVYSKIVGFFLFLTIVAIFVILHFALSKATITIKSQTGTKEGTVLVEMFSENNSEPNSEILIGKIMDAEMEIDASVPSDQEIVESDKAGGYVTIYNNYSQDQILIATTRLLTPDDKLFRIADRVEIPANGEVKVWAEADQAGDEMVTGPTTFIIPGLWEGLQDKIYADTAEGMKLQSLPRYTVSQDNIDQAHNAIVEAATNEAIKTINDVLPESLAIGPDRLYLESEITSSSQIGDSSEEALVVELVKVHGLVFAEDDLYNIAKAKFAKEMESDESLLDFDPEKINYDIIEIDTENEKAVIEVSLSATVNDRPENLEINKDELIGLDETGVKEYFKQQNIENVEVKFFPFWVKTVPNIKDHIIIE